MSHVELTSRDRLFKRSGRTAAQPAAIISAGLQEWEAHGDGVAEDWPAPVHNLDLYARADRVLECDPALAEALHDKQLRLRDMQADYRIRLKHAVAAVDELERRDRADDRPSVRDAYAALRALDRRHLQQVRKIHAEPVPDSAALDEERAAVAQQLAAVSQVLIAGGHVAVLRNRMRMLGVDALLDDKEVIAWGAGAMVCTERVVLFLEHSARGRREPEVLDAGVGLAQRVVVIPEARQRLKLDDLPRCASLHTRFTPARCISLDANSSVLLDGSRITAVHGGFRLTPTGRASRVRLS